MAIDYLEGTNKRIFGEMLRELKIRVRNNEGVFTAELSSAHNYVKHYIRPYYPRNKTLASSRAVYSTDQLIGTCRDANDDSDPGNVSDRKDPWIKKNARNAVDIILVFAGFLK